MWKTALLLVVTFVIIPFLAFRFDEPLTHEQIKVFTLLGQLCISLALIAFALSTITNNYSQVDKLWSVMPIVYVWIVALYGNFEPRLVLMASLVTVWGLRLTYNFSRRGGYHWKFWEGEEDYRWAVLRAKPEFNGWLRWGLFNLFFISLYQMGLILMFTLPILKSMEGKPLGLWDLLLSVLFVSFVILETIADQQQWNFHKEKTRRIQAAEEPGEKYSRGFISSGLWGWMRHPNYAAEQAVWIVFYLFSIAATGIWINWSIVGCLLLVFLFKGSSDFSESISAGKYPDFAAYQQRVGRFFPNLGPRKKSSQN